MSISTSWIHGNAVTMESPYAYKPNGEVNGQLILTPFGWGTSVVSERGGESSWFHIPIPTRHPSNNQFDRLRLLRVFLLVRCTDASITPVHIYDGPYKIDEFTNQTLVGDHLSVSHVNTFEILGGRGYRVRYGISVSFLFKSQILTGGQGGAPHGELLVAAAGAQFESTNLLVSTILQVFPPVRFGG